MNIQTNQTKPTGAWNRTVHASFGKVIPLDIEELGGIIVQKEQALDKLKKFYEKHKK